MANDCPYFYTRARRAFGTECVFSDSPPDGKPLRLETSHGEIDAEAYDAKFFAEGGVLSGAPSPFVLNPESVSRIDTTPVMSESIVAPAAVLRVNKSMCHTQGGWPSDVDIDDPAAQTRYRRKKEKGMRKAGDGGASSSKSDVTPVPLAESIKPLSAVISMAAMQNKTVDIYEQYFDGEVIGHAAEAPSATGVAVFSDPTFASTGLRRTVTSIDWHPDGPSKFAATYAVMRFQDPRLSAAALPVDSYIWDVHNPNAPEVALKAASPLTCLRFNPKNADLLVGGSYNGLVSFFDRRRAGTRVKSITPHEVSAIEYSHHDPVFDVRWTQSKSGNLCVSASTDGRLLWWDTRRLGEPTSELWLRAPTNGGMSAAVDEAARSSGEGGVGMMSFGACSLAYDAEAGASKYLVGTEQGAVVGVDTRIKKDNGITPFTTGQGAHHAPIYSIARNPAHSKCVRARAPPLVALHFVVASRARALAALVAAHALHVSLPHPWCSPPLLLLACPHQLLPDGWRLDRTIVVG
jgi:dynein intermediate chain 2